MNTPKILPVSVDYGNDIRAEDVDGNDAEEIAKFILEGVADNDIKNNDGNITEWSYAQDAVSVYSDNIDARGQRIYWTSEALEDAELIVEASMIASGHITENS